ncbi:MAG: hypothetical protein AAF583_07110 [Pseudomonadota bacterium]
MMTADEAFELSELLDDGVLFTENSKIWRNAMLVAAAFGVPEANWLEYKFAMRGAAREYYGWIYKNDHKRRSIFEGVSNDTHNMDVPPKAVIKKISKALNTLMDYSSSYSDPRIRIALDQTFVEMQEQRRDEYGKLTATDRRRVGELQQAASFVSNADGKLEALADLLNAVASQNFRRYNGWKREHHALQGSIKPLTKFWTEVLGREATRNDRNRAFLDELALDYVYDSLCDHQKFLYRCLSVLDDNVQPEHVRSTLR